MVPTKRSCHNTRDIHVKYRSSNTYYSKIISKVNISDSLTGLQNGRQNKNKMPRSSISGIENEIEGATVHLKGYAERCILIIPF